MSILREKALEGNGQAVTGAFHESWRSKRGNLAEQASSEGEASFDFAQDASFDCARLRLAPLRMT